MIMMMMVGYGWADDDDNNDDDDDDEYIGDYSFMYIFIHPSFSSSIYVYINLCHSCDNTKLQMHSANCVLSSIYRPSIHLDLLSTFQDVVTVLRLCWSM